MMPGGDGTGPMGGGPRTGRGAGWCAGFGTAGYANRRAGRGFWGRGAAFNQGGRGWWRWFGPDNAPDQAESSALRSRIDMIQDQLQAIKERLEAMKSDSSR